MSARRATGVMVMGELQMLSSPTGALS